MTKRAAVVVTAVLAGGCGADDDSSPAPAATAGPAAQVLKVVAPPSGTGKFHYDRRRLEARAGAVTFALVNRDRWGHNLRIQTGRKCCFDENGKDLGGTETVQPAKTLRATVSLKPGRYFFVCAFPSHWGDGMWGRLTVR